VTDDAAAVEFAPVAVEGASGVTSCRITPEAVFLGHGEAELRRVQLESIARYRSPAAWWRLIHRLGLSRRPRPVGERDWCQPEGHQFFRFFTDPPLVIYLPAQPDAPYGETLFARIRETLWRGGFCTDDLA
jgi:hypothetical protein